MSKVIDYTKDNEQWHALYEDTFDVSYDYTFWSLIWAKITRTTRVTVLVHCEQCPEIGDIIRYLSLGKPTEGKIYKVIPIVRHKNMFRLFLTFKLKKGIKCSK